MMKLKRKLSFPIFLVLALALVPLYELSISSGSFFSRPNLGIFPVELNLNLGLNLPNYTGLNLIDVDPVAIMWNLEDKFTRPVENSEIYQNKEKATTPESESETERLKETLKQIGKWALIFNGLERVFNNVLFSLVPTYMSSLNKIDRRLYVSYSISFIHSGAVAFLCVKNILKGMNIPMEKRVEIHPLNQQIGRVMTGYFINDLIGTRHVWLKNPADLGHHMFGIILCGVSGHIPFSDILFYIPHVAVIELSTIFMNIAVLIRGINKAPRNPAHLSAPEQVIEKYSKITFALTFVLLRCVFYPLVLLRIHQRVPEQFRQLGFGLVRPTTFALAVLQYYWAYKIYRMVSKHTLKTKH